MTVTLKVSAVAVALATCVISARARQAPRDLGAASATGSASITGVVRATDSGSQPVRRAVVTLSGAAIGVDRIVITSDDGSFTFAALPAGRFTVAARKAAWVTSYFGGRRPGHGPGTPIALADGQHEAIRMTMARGAVIAGHVRDHVGQACVGEVRLLESRVLNGVATLTPVAASPATVQDGYRFYGLAPGSYLAVARYTTPADMNGHHAQSASEIDAALRDLAAGRVPVVTDRGPAPGAVVLGPPIGYGPTFYPGTADPALATPIVVAAGEERADIDISLQSVPAATLAGIVVDATGRPAQGLQLAVISPSVAMGFNVGFILSASVSTRNGAFSRDGQTPGHYSLFARAEEPRDAVENSPPPAATGAPGALTLWGAAEVDLDGHDVPNLVITLQHGMTVAGRLVVDAPGLAAPNDLTSVQLKLTAIATRGFNLNVPAARAQADGTFRFTGVPPGLYVISATVPGGWALTSARAGNTETLDGGLAVTAGNDVADLVVTMTDRPTVLTGSLLDQLARPAPEYTVVVFSTDKRFWTIGSRRVVQQRPAHDGKFLVSGLPPGEYFVGAVTDLEGVDLADAAFLEGLAAASTKVSLTKGETRTLDLQTRGPSPVMENKR